MGSKYSTDRKFPLSQCDLHHIRCNASVSLCSASRLAAVGGWTLPGGPDDRPLENMKMHIKSLLGQIKRIRLLTAALLTASAVGGWGAATLLAANAAVVENATRLEQSLSP